MSILNVIGREKVLFSSDLESSAEKLHDIISSSRFLVIGGAGSIGKQLLKKFLSAIP